MKRSQQTRRRLDDRGAGAVEFAFFSTMVVGLLVGGIDVVNYARARLKLDEVSNVTASLVSTYQQLYANDFPTLFQVAQQTAGGLDVTKSYGATIITGITNSNGTPVVAWRQRKSDNTALVSALGAVGSAPSNLPDGYVVPVGSSLVAVEVFGSVQPWVLRRLLGYTATGGLSTLGSITLFQPRSALLSQVNSGSRP